MTSKIVHEGIIVEIESGAVQVRIEQNTACSECHAKGACTISDKKEKLIEIPKADNISSNLKVGDKVQIEGTTHQGLKAVFYSFVIPLILVFAVLIFSLRYLQDEAIAACLAFVALILYYVFLYILKDKFKKKFVFSLTNIRQKT